MEQKSSASLPDMGKLGISGLIFAKKPQERVEPHI